MVLNYNYNDTINYLKKNNLNAQKSVQELIDIFELGDVYRPGTNWTYSSYSLYTWSAYSNSKQERLGYFLVWSTDLTGLVESIHSNLVVMNMIITHQEKGRGFLKFNDSLLSQQPYLKWDCRWKQN